MDLNCPVKKYSKYSREMRLELIRLVDGEKLSTAHAARLLGIKQTSACRMMKSYHNHHKIFERKADRLSRQQAQTLPLSIHPIDPEDLAIHTQAQNGINNTHERTPLGQLSGNSPSTGVSEYGTIQESSTLGGVMGISMGGMATPCFPFYYTGVYPFIFNYFV